MEPAQFTELMNVLGDLVETLEKPMEYSITGASDWEILVGFGSFFMIVMVAGFKMILGAIEKNDRAWRGALGKHEKDNEKDFDILHDIQKECQADCCPPRVGHQPNHADTAS